jgi:hypothetical protein
LTPPLYWHLCPSRRSTFDKVHDFDSVIKKLSNMFASFVYTILFFELVSYIDIKLKFYIIIVFYDLV